jgi:SpoVK/Ycf46/Vps4 family AAA+-type ATPase
MADMIQMSEEEICKLIEMTKGYSGADLKALSTEAAMMPLREITDVQNCEVGSIRPLGLKDFEEALKNVRRSVNQKDLNHFLDWNDSYGSFPIKEEDIKD